METKPIYKRLAELVTARHNCIRSSNPEWQNRHEEKIDAIMDTAPSGSGFDSGTTLRFDTSGPEVLKFSTSFHHMNDVGYYDGCTEHIVTVKGSLMYGFTIHVSGRNRNGIKDYIADVFDTWLRTPADV